jgi:hypothetical protein
MRVRAVSLFRRLEFASGVAMGVAMIGVRLIMMLRI